MHGRNFFEIGKLCQFEMQMKVLKAMGGAEYLKFLRALKNVGIILGILKKSRKF
jgi:hypothetical protein